MADLVFKVDGGKVNYILNGKDVRIQLNFDEENPDSGLGVSITNYKLGLDASKKGNIYIADGAIGKSNGIWEGLPFEASLVAGSDTLILTDGFLNFAAPDVDFMCDKIEAEVMEKGGNAWLQNNEDAYTYAFLASDSYTGAGKILPSDYIFVPYVLLKDTTGLEIAMMLISGYVLATQISNIVQEIINIALEIGGSFLAIVVSALEIIVLLAFLVLLIVAMVEILEQLYDSVIGRVKYHATMKLRTLLEKGAESLGQKFESTVFDDPFWNDVVIMPEKFDAPQDLENENIFGFLTPDNEVQTGFYRGTFGDLMRECKKMWNARKIVGGGVIRIEPMSVNISEPGYTMPKVEILSKKTNANDLKALYEFRFATDLNDVNTIKEFEGTITEVVTRPNSIDNEDMVLMKGREKISSQFALGKKKDELTQAEKIFINILKVTSAGLRVITLGIDASGVAKLADKVKADVEDRIDMLKISSNQIQVPKILAINISTSSDRATRQKSTQENRLKSNFIIDDFHQSSFFVPSQAFPDGNQWEIYQTKTDVRFCFEDFRKLKPENAPSNNLIFDNEGRLAILDSLEWNPTESRASIKWRVNKLYSNNINLTKNTPDGL